MAQSVPPPVLEERREAPDWHQLDHLVEGARQRGFSAPQCEYLASCIGLAWAKGKNAGRTSR